ncbi:MAG: hypothetical protein M0C28_11330 [Candidatus Moduliflexus flocculans]|nr:hypothetical protein [Candidatus Moduliflexus flocculans]
MKSGRYEFFTVEAELVTPPSKSFYVMSKMEVGQFYEGSRFSLGLIPTWNISRHFEAGLTYNFDHVYFNTSRKMNNHIAGIKLMYMLNTKLSVNAYIQYNTAYNEALTNFRLRYNPKEGMTFILYSTRKEYISRQGNTKASFIQFKGGDG